MPKVSVIMPVYNSARFLREAIESILNQTFQDFELIIILEQGCHDESEAIIHQYIDVDDRIVLLKNEGARGISHSLNRGIVCSKGVYIARMDADDISLPNRLQRQVEFLDSNPEIAICGSEVVYINEQGLPTSPLHDNFPREHEKIKAGLLFNCVIKHPSVMWRKEELERHGLFYNENFSSSEDYELWSRACHKVKMANMDEVLLMYRIHEGNNTQTRIKEGSQNYLRVMSVNFERLGLIFTEEELHILCPLTCRTDEKNKKHVMKTLLKCAEKIREANKERGIYDSKTLDEVLEVRAGWAKYKARHKIVTGIRIISGVFKRISPNGSMVYVLNKIASHLELYGLKSLLRKIGLIIRFSELRRYIYDKK